MLKGLRNKSYVHCTAAGALNVRKIYKKFFVSNPAFIMAFTRGNV